MVEVSPYDFAVHGRMTVDRLRIDGVSIALMVLRALGRSRGTVAIGELAAAVPRSSLYRVIKRWRRLASSPGSRER